jgi:dTDP-glucose 4,6-dehydratase
LLLSDTHDPVNIGNQDELTMLDLAKEIVELTGSRSEIVFRELPEDDPKIRQPDTTRARTLLQWHARVDRKDGLRKTIEYFRSQLA